MPCPNNQQSTSLPGGEAGWHRDAPQPHHQPLSARRLPRCQRCHDPRPNQRRSALESSSRNKKSVEWSGPKVSTNTSLLRWGRACASTFFQPAPWINSHRLDLEN
ncbi:hypothetical protein I7I53_01252 [Histoplasma capsulatum var. duboisii H88]|uniref:Uncharacterized protein n=1 Tax=Ajellomyces capsulatus (strain H88) TaxID=544711 RepID=A0A8A1LPD0_AJEC8|nr:hypothetical protein I7I53_01252 [Histoplasma capsulatum var. duboisii H88]